MEKIVLTGGGTAGHVTPNIALFDGLRENGFEIYYIGSIDGIEKELVGKEKDVEYFGIHSGKMRRYFSMKNVTDVFSIIKGYFDARAVLKKVKPDIVFSKGGFVTVPVVYAARSRKIKVITHESDITPGLANRLTKKCSNKVCLTFPDALKQVPPPKGVFTGTPIRKALYNGDGSKAKQALGFDDKPVLLMMGGSIGAKSLNDVLRKSVPELTKKLNIIHLCGKGNLDPDMEGIKGYKQFEYLHGDLPDYLALADYIMSRAGSNAIHEFLALNKPMLLIPLPLSASRGDQILNAESFKSRGYALVLEQENMNEESLIAKVGELIEKAPEIVKNMKANPSADGTNAVIDVILTVSGKKKNDKV